MTAVTAPAPEHPQPRGVFLPALRSEWTKLRTLRSTYWILLAALVITVGLSFLLATRADVVGAQFGASPVATSLAGTKPGKLAIAALGVLTITAEYGTGMIRSTLTAVPQRLRVLAAKTLAFATVTLIVGELAAFLSFFVGRAFFATHGVTVSLADEGALRAVVGGGLYLTASGVFGIAVGTLLRNTAVALVVTIAALFPVPELAALLPGTWGTIAGKYLLTNPGEQVMQPHTGSDALSPWVGYGIFWMWIVAIALVAAALFVRRDA